MPTLRALALLAVTALSASAAEVKYQLAPDFLGTPPGKATIGNGHGEIAVDSAGLIYVSVQEKDAGIQVYGQDGKYLKSFGALGKQFTVRVVPAACQRVQYDAGFQGVDG